MVIIDIGIGIVMVLLISHLVIVAISRSAGHVKPQLSVVRSASAPGSRGVLGSWWLRHVPLLFNSTLTLSLAVVGTTMVVLPE